ncbi:hypothetical protein ACTXT7_015063 [Hymenolepis weldensis]
MSQIVESLPRRILDPRRHRTSNNERRKKRPKRWKHNATTVGTTSDVGPFLSNLPNFNYRQFVQRGLRLSLKDWSENFCDIFDRFQRLHWHYFDNYAMKQHYPKLTMRRLFEEVESKVPQFLPWRHNWREKFEFWLRVQQTIPVASVVLLDENLENCLLVESFFQKTWFFPGGKVEKNESFKACAIRETMEELSFDIANIINEELSFTVSGPPRTVQIFLVEGVSKQTTFKCQTMCELRGMQWFPISKLAQCSNTAVYRPTEGENSINFSLVSQYICGINNYTMLRKEGIDPLNSLARCWCYESSKSRSGKEHERLFPIQPQSKERITLTRGNDWGVTTAKGR